MGGEGFDSMLQPRVVGILYGRLETLGLQPSTTASLHQEETAPRHLPSHLASDRLHPRQSEPMPRVLNGSCPARCRARSGRKGCRVGRAPPCRRASDWRHWAPLAGSIGPAHERAAVAAAERDRELFDQPRKLGASWPVLANTYSTIRKSATSHCGGSSLRAVLNWPNRPLRRAS